MTFDTTSDADFALNWYVWHGSNTICTSNAHQSHKMGQNGKMSVASPLLPSRVMLYDDFGAASFTIALSQLSL
jgi:hypothetical protein